MEIRVLRYFLTTAREGSITRAAELLHITQPTLSRQLAALEAEVGVTLFHRGSRNLTLTEEGLLLMRRSEEILELTDKTARELSARDSELEGTIFLGAGEIIGMPVLAELCRSFREIHPRVRFEMYSATANVIAERMQRGLTDVSLVLEPVDMEQYEFIRLPQKERWVALLRPEDPLVVRESVTASDLRERTLILPYRLNLQSELANWFGPDFDRLDIACSGNMPTNLGHLVRAGLGCALVTEGSAALMDSDKLVTRPLDPPLTSGCAIIWRRGQLFGSAAERFIQYVTCLLGMDKA